VELKQPLTYLKGVGPERAKILLEELGIRTIEDLLYHFPFRYVDKSQVYNINQVIPSMPLVQVKGKLLKMGEVGEARKKRLTAILKDETGELELVWFKGITWVKNQFKIGDEVVAFGKPNLFGRKINIAHPELTLFRDFVADKEQAGNFQPVYSTTEKLTKRSLNSKGIEKIIKPVIYSFASQIFETLPPYIREENKLLPLAETIRNIHQPTNYQQAELARYRIKFEELFYLQMQLVVLKLIGQKKRKGYLFPEVGDMFNHFYTKNLPFELTGAQKRVVKEIRADLKTGIQMNRLVQGDVGSGKTLVALLVMLLAVDNNFQACLMAPTEILAQQHYETLKEFLAGMPIQVVILTGSSKAAKRRQIATGLESGQIPLIVGTHALLEDKVMFKNIGLVVIDEQHRFGVAQRAKLWTKNELPPHVLVMTATPIPRTLAMTVYGDLDISAIDELPPGRKPVRTAHKFEGSRLEVFGFMQRELDKGRQIYVVYPLIEESEKLDYQSVTAGYEIMLNRFPRPQYQVSMLHGKMPPEHKEAEMQRFKKGETHIMVATTVIEVGVNIPNASIMIIENAERFGLSQLHQLRGRVGRGAEQSYCILMSGNKLSAEGKERLKTMVRTTDGFEIAEADLKLRGPGDILGTQQSGMVNLKLADLIEDQDILSKARDTALKIMEEDEKLEKPEHLVIKNTLREKLKYKLGWSKIS
jgi:ATP-dependent DNA helicase RecG